MRVTNGMTINNLLINLNKNMYRLDKLQYQASTGNKIQFPSDDPIVAGRALKFRTNVSETEQFIANTNQAASWMQTAEMAYKNVEQIILRIQELSVQASSDSYTVSDRKTIVQEISELTKELSSEINVTYAGRYVFSGYRTDEPPVFQVSSDRIFKNIMQDFNVSNIQKSSALTPVVPATTPTEYTTADVNRLLLPYTLDDSNTLGHTMSVKSLRMTVPGNPPKVTVVNVSDSKNSTDINAYNNVTAPRWIKDTGELLLPDNFLSGYTDEEKSKMTITAIYDKTGFNADDINPVNYFSCDEKNIDGSAKRSYTMDNQTIYFELGTNNKVQINNLAKDVFTPQFFADLNDIVRFCNNINEQSETQLKQNNPGMTDDDIAKYMEEQSTIFRNALHTRFSQLLPKMDTHHSNYSMEYTELGSRMNRIEFIENRLKDDYLNFTDLRDENELVDIAETMINLSNVTAVYQSALSTGAGIIQKSLVDFI